MNERFVLSRRALLGSLGALGATALLPRGARRAHAQTIPTRFVFVHVPEGMWSGAARPVSGGTALGPIFDGVQSHQSKILVINNLNMQSRDHGPGGDGHHRGVPHMITGTEMQDESNAGGISLDQKIANAIGKSSPIASLQLAVRIVYGDTNARPLWSGPGRVVPAIQSPWEAYDRVFKNFMPPSTDPMAKPPVDLRKSALDYSLAEINSLRSKLAPTDLALLDSYQDSLRDIERRLTTMPPPPTGGAACAPPTLGSAVDTKSEANYVKIGELQMDLMVAALQCGVTRVASLQFGNSNDQCSYSFLGVNNLGHDLAHNNNNCDSSGAKKLKVFQWYATRAKYLLDKLDSIPEGSGTMLDNTCILWASEFSDSNGHASDKLTWLLMGNANGYFKSGRILNANGKSTNDVLASIQNAFGIADAKFGNPAYCAGAMADLKA
ncbi:MAG TPA: DUF1552 domain-containing protein [Polyangiales bacterium]|nr:DUF1552 domain-containing protein [Polyangiales bacterium]